MPQEAKIVALILRSMGVEEYEPNVIPQLLEFMHRYVTDVLQDSVVYAEHSGKNVLDLDDIKLAIQSRVNYSFTQPPPREVMLELAQRKNNIPLPFIPSSDEVKLPPASLQCKPFVLDIKTKDKKGKEKGEKEKDGTVKEEASIAPMEISGAADNVDGDSKDTMS